MTSGFGRWRPVWILLVAVSLLLAACGQGSEPEDTGSTTTAASTDTSGAVGSTTTSETPSLEGEIVIAIGTEPPNLDPQLRNDGGERAVNDNVYEALLARDAAGTLVPHLAAELPTLVDDDTWEVVLREGITFSNGEVLDAEAVAASFRRLIDPATESELGSFWGTFTEFEVVDERTIRFHTNGPDPTVPGKLYFLKVVPPQHSQSAGFGEEPIGTGPYLFKEWNRGQEVVLEANPDYWGEPKPTIGRVVIRFVPEPATRLAGVLSGEIDLITNLSPDEVSQVPNAVNVPGIEHPYIIPNSIDGVTADPRVRQALSYAIDREALAEELFAGAARVDNCQPFTPAVVGYNPNLEPYPFDPDMARALLAEAGAEGATIELTSQAGRWLKDRELTEAVAAYWGDVGLTVNVQFYEFSEFLDRLWADVRPMVILTYGSTETFDANNALSYNVAPSGAAASNDNADFEERVVAARTELDPSARQQLYNELSQDVCDEAYIIHLLSIDDRYGLSARVDWQPRVDGKLIVNEMTLTG